MMHSYYYMYMAGALDLFYHCLENLFLVVLTLVTDWLGYARRVSVHISYFYIYIYVYISNIYIYIYIYLYVLLYI